MKKIFLSGISAGAIVFILGMLLSRFFVLFPAVSADYKNTALMRSWQDPLMSLFFLYPFVLGIILAWAWNKSKMLFQGSTVNRGIKFGFTIWLISSIPGMLISYSCFQISLLTIISWIASGLVNGIAAGIIFAKMNQ